MPTVSGSSNQSVANDVLRNPLNVITLEQQETDNINGKIRERERERERKSGEREREREKEWRERNKEKDNIIVTIKI